MAVSKSAAAVAAVEQADGIFEAFVRIQFHHDPAGLGDAHFEPDQSGHRRRKHGKPTFVAVDGGIADNLEASSYVGTDFDAVLADRPVTVVSSSWWVDSASPVTCSRPTCRWTTQWSVTWSRCR